MKKVLPTANAFGFYIVDFSKNPRRFWAIVQGMSQVPFAIKAEYDDIEDFCMEIPGFEYFKSLKHYFSSMNGEQYTQWVYMFVNHLISCNEKRSKQVVMAQIMRLIRLETGEPIGDMYANAGVKIAGYTMDVFARRADHEYAYTSPSGEQYIVWMEIKGVQSLTEWVIVYGEIVRYYTLKASMS